MFVLVYLFAHISIWNKKNFFSKIFLEKSFLLARASAHDVKSCVCNEHEWNSKKQSALSGRVDVRTDTTIEARAQAKAEGKGKEKQHKMLYTIVG